MYASIEDEIQTVLRQFPAAAVTELTKTLDDPQPSARAAAARALGDLRSVAQPAIPLLLRRLQDDKEVQIAVIGALTAIRDTSDSVRDGLLSRLKDADAHVRIWAARCLIELRIDDGSAIDLLSLELKSDNVANRTSAAWALRRLEGLAEQAISSLITALRDDAAGVRRPAVEALGQIGSKVAVLALIGALSDPDEFVAHYGATSLGQIGPEAESAVPHLIKACASADYFMRNYAANALGEIASRPDECLPVLIGLLSDKSDLVVSAAANALVSFKAQESTPELLKLLRSDRSENVRFSAALALGRISKSDATVEALVQTLNERSNTMRRFAAAALGNIGKDAVRAQGALVAALAKEEDSARIEIAGAIIRTGGDPEAALKVLSGVLRDPTDSMEKYWATSQIEKIGVAAKPLLPDLISALKSDNTDMRGTSARALGVIGADIGEVILALEALLDDQIEEIRVNAAEALWRINRHPKSLPALQVALQNRDEWAARSAAEALGKIGPDAIVAVPALQAALRDHNFRVRRAVRAALPKITGKPFSEEESASPVRRHR